MYDETVVSLMNPAELMMAMDKNESDMNKFLKASTATYALAMWKGRKARNNISFI